MQIKNMKKEIINSELILLKIDFYFKRKSGFQNYSVLLPHSCYWVVYEHCSQIECTLLVEWMYFALSCCDDGVKANSHSTNTKPMNKVLRAKYIHATRKVYLTTGKTTRREQIIIFFSRFGVVFLFLKSNHKKLKKQNCLFSLIFPSPRLYFSTNVPL